MAGLGGKNWSFQEEVTSSDVNGFLADQVVMRFADAATRTAGFGGAGEPTLAEGMVSYLDDTNSLEVYNGSTWTSVNKILQVVSTTKTDAFSGTLVAGSELEVTGLNLTITPSSTSSKIFILSNVVKYFWGNIKLKRGSTDICIGDAAGSRSRVSATSGGATTAAIANSGSIMFLDSPATTSATTYKIFLQSTNSNNVTVYVNRSETDTDSTHFGRYASTITAFEVTA